MPKFLYRELIAAEELRDERFLGNRILGVLSRKLSLGAVELRFIERDDFGEHTFPSPTAGFCPPTGRVIFVRRGLGYVNLCRVVAHELRHLWQRETGRHCLSVASRERDAFLFETEIASPLEDRAILRWIVEQEYEAAAR